MLVKLRQTLKEKFEKSKEYTTKAQQEKNRLENKKVVDRTRSMIIWNIILSLTLKLPVSSYSFINIFIYIFKSNPDNSSNHPLIQRFIVKLCVNSSLCDFIFVSTAFLYLIYISIQFFFYKHYDKKLSKSYKSMFQAKKSS